jgi:hypothetical protein
VIAARLPPHTHTHTHIHTHKKHTQRHAVHSPATKDAYAMMRTTADSSMPVESAWAMRTYLNSSVAATPNTKPTSVLPPKMTKKLTPAHAHRSGVAFCGRSTTYKTHRSNNT